MDRKILLYGVIAAAVAVLAVGAYLLFWPTGEGSSGVSPQTTRLEIGADEHTLGSANAPIQIVEYGAPVCPHCANFNETVFPLLKTQYIDTGKVHYIFRVFPIHPADFAVEGMARCVPKQEYFQFIDLLFRNQPKWDPEFGVQDVHAGLIDMSRIAGMDAQRADVCMSDADVRSQVEKQAQDATAKYSIASIPAFVIDGELVHTGHYPWEELRALLDSKLAKKTK